MLGFGCTDEYQNITHRHKGTLNSETVPKAHFSDHKI